MLPAPPRCELGPRRSASFEGGSTAIPDHRPPGLTLYTYLARELIRPTLLSLLGLTSVVLTKDLMGYTDLIINRGMGAEAVFQIAFFEVVPLLTMIFPLAVLMGVLFAMGRLGADLEILVLETLGVRATRLAGPIGLFACVMALACLFLSLVATPWASRSLDEALEALSRKNPAAQIRAGVINRFGDWQLEAREVTARGDEMTNVLLWLPSLGDTVFANSGTLTANADGGIDMALERGRVLLRLSGESSHVEFERLETTLPESDRPVLRKEHERIAGMTFEELRALALAEAAKPGTYPTASIEMNRRFATPVTTLLFGLIAIPLFLTRSEYSRSAGGNLGLLTMVAYFGVVQLGDGLIQDGTLSVPVGVWLPNILLAAIGAWGFARIAHKGVFGRELDRQRGGGRKQARSQKHYRGPKTRALDRYIAASFIRFVVLSFSVLLAAYLLIDVLDRLQWFAKYEATRWEVLRFYGARVPVLASRVIPMSLLVGTALTASSLAIQGELMGMRSLGISAPRALLPLLIICAIMVPLYFTLNNEVIPKAAARQDEIKRVEIKKRQANKEKAPPVWYRVEDQLYQVAMLDGERGRAEDITAYELGKDGLPTSRTDASSALYIGRGNWRLREALRFELRNGAFEDVEARPFAMLGEKVPAEVDTMHFSVGQLSAEIADIEKNGLDASALRVDLQVKYAAPFACLVLPALVLFFVVSGPPFPSSATTLLVSGALAIGQVLLSGTFASLGYGGVLTPVVAGWGPTAIFTSISIYAGLRLRAKGQPLSSRSRPAEPKAVEPTS